MRILFNEIRKLFSVKIICLLLLVSFIVYQQFIMFEFKHFPNGRPLLDDFRATQKMLVDYGESMDSEEFKDFKGIKEQRISEATAYLKSQKEMVAAGIDTYEEFSNMDLENEKLAALHSKIIFEDYVDVFWEIQARDWIIDRYEHPERFNEHELTPKQNARMDELVKSGSTEAIFTDMVFDNYNVLIKYVANLIFLNIMIILMPLYIRDKRNHVQLLQYTSKTGRSLFSQKLLTGISAAMIVITAQLAFFFFMYRGNDTSMFFSLSINSIFNFFVSWFDLTFFQYIVLTVICVYLLGIALVLVGAWISSIAPNYMTSVGLHVPLAFLLFGSGTAYLIQNLTTIYLNPYLVPISFVIILVLSSLLFMWRYRSEKVKNI
ncbi:hypothetical protein ABE65_019650 [Fictibacillus phosphorivorans]|uniref:Uncharacterized protein n=1 Tax=Fictibacillus phosphorivorans TaxID=1221500 RepID=A0A160IR33_9BACL|nr:hypothetical protein [Fictibacillus phosphorivorans]ANC78894.1 hypothetical protein ABE65_019650 [Fictibacillus phosphorivorans]